MITAIVLTKNEEANIADCLAALQFCDELLVVDSGSTDRTVDIARAAGAKIAVYEDWQGYGMQLQRAATLVKTDWVLIMDADERVPPALAKEIIAAVNSGEFSVYELNRKTMFLGRFLHHGGWFPDWIPRLAKREFCRFHTPVVHGRMIATDKMGRLPTPFLHYSYQSLDDVLAKLRKFAVGSAKNARSQNKRGGLTIAIFKSAFIFIKSYIFQAGFLDGRQGLIAAIVRAQEMFWRYLGIGWEKDRQ